MEGLKQEKQILCKIILYQYYSEDLVFKTPFSKFSSFFLRGVGGLWGGNDNDEKQRLKRKKLKEQQSTRWLYQEEMSRFLYGYNVGTIISNISEH